METLASTAHQPLHRFDDRDRKETSNTLIRTHRQGSSVSTENFSIIESRDSVKVSCHFVDGVRIVPLRVLLIRPLLLTHLDC